MLSLFKKPEIVAPQKKPLPISRQVIYSSSNQSLFNPAQSSFTDTLLQHLSFAEPHRETGSLSKGTLFIAFSKTSNPAVVFPLSVQKDKALWKKLTAFADKNKFNIGMLRLTAATDAKKLTKDGQTVYLVNSALLEPCKKLYDAKSIATAQAPTVAP